MSLTSFVTSLFSTVYADAPAEESKVEEPTAEETPEASEEVASEAASEEDEEPEDLHPQIREECQNSALCAPHTKHYMHCQEKVNNGEGFKGEDCVEEFMMHCADACAAPKLFSKLH